MNLIIDFKDNVSTDGKKCVAALIGTRREVADMLGFPFDKEWSSDIDFVEDVKTKFIGTEVIILNKISGTAWASKITHVYS